MRLLAQTGQSRGTQMLGKLLRHYTNMQNPSVGLLGAARLLAIQPCNPVFLFSGNLVASSLSRGTFCLLTHQMRPSSCCRSHKLHTDRLATSKKPFSLNSTAVTIIILITTSHSHQSPQHLLCNTGPSRQQSHGLRRHALFPLAAQPKKERIKKEIGAFTTESSQR